MADPAANALMAQIRANLGAVQSGEETPVSDIPKVDIRVNAQSTAEPEQPYVTAEEFLSGTPGVEEQQVKVMTQWGELTVPELLARLGDAESKRAGFQSEAMIAKAHAEKLKSEYAAQFNQARMSQQIPPSEKELVAPKPADFMKGVDPNDVDARLEAMSKYYEASNQYTAAIMERKMEAKIAEARRLEQAISQARELASLDERFRNPDGSPNIPEIHAYLDQSTQSWSQVYRDKMDAQRYRQMVEEAAKSLKPNGNIQPPVEQRAFSTGQTVSGGGGGSASPIGTNGITKQLEEIQRRYGAKFSLPPGAKIIR